jgi:hypothetical protein
MRQLVAEGGRVWGSVPPPERARRINRTARANGAPVMQRMAHELLELSGKNWIRWITEAE